MSEGNNPPVRSKFDRSHGHGLPATKVDLVHSSIPATGTTVAGHNEHGAKYPQRSTLTLGKGEHKGR